MAARSVRGTSRDPSGRCSGDDGASLVEYALLLAFIVVACIAAVTFLGGNLSSNINDSTSELFVSP